MIDLVMRAGRALLMGLAWAVVWVPVGMVVGSLIVGELEPEWVGGPLYAGVLCGVTFSVVTGLASGRHRLDALPVLRAGAWGALSGALVGMLPFVLGEPHGTDRPLWVLPVAVISTMTLVSALSAAAAVPLARMIRKNIEAAEASMANRRP